MQVVRQLLDPRTSEFTAAFVGRLVSTLISKAGRELGEHLDQILRAILSKMQQAETLSVMQSLIMVFAHLVHTQLEPLLEFLCSLPGPTGKPALEFVMAEWTSRQHLFYGQYEGKVRCRGVTGRLLMERLGVVWRRELAGGRWASLQDGVAGSRSLTRSLFFPPDPERWTNIPLLVKILKLIINELSNVMEANAARQAAPAEWGQDDSNDMWEDEEEDQEDEEEGGGLAGQLLSDILATSKYEEDYYEDDEEDDPDALKDPLYQVDLQVRVDHQGSGGPGGRNSWRLGFSCEPPTFCCGTCRQRYCCGDRSLRLSEFQQKRCLVFSPSPPAPALRQDLPAPRSPWVPLRRPLPELRPPRLARPRIPCTPGVGSPHCSCARRPVSLASSSSPVSATAARLPRNLRDRVCCLHRGPPLCLPLALGVAGVTHSTGPRPSHPLGRAGKWTGAGRELGHE
ncbi:Importin-9 [Myotis davidii]|uniref:Importin-9 n=1 Tax=Myotis davidii TaxID=225400 RepID=L5MB49_MYODS|nr:Importin-9 [Myotis davidii]